MNAGGWGARVSFFLVLALLSSPASARPRARHRPATRHAPRGPHHTGGVLAGDALWQTGGALAAPPAESDAQALVSTGKVPPFYNPSDLAHPPVLAAPAAILIDADTGQTLWGKNVTERRFPASTTKILTSLIFIEHTNPSDVITCMDPNITRIEPSSLNIKPWEKFTAQDLLCGTLLRSGNDGAVLMAEHVAGSVEKFSDLMNARAREIGATDSHFVTPNGLHDPEHYTTVRDMALIAREAMRNPRFADAVSLPVRTISRSILTRDSVISTKAKKYWERFPGADGVKTGYTRLAGHCFVGSASRDGRRLLAVIFDANRSAVNDTVPLLSWGFTRYAQVPLARKGDREPPVVIRGGLPGVVATFAASDLHASYDSLKPEERTDVSTAVESANAAAPVKRGDIVGRLVARLHGRVIGTVPLAAASAVFRSPLGFLSRPGGVSAGIGGLQTRSILLRAVTAMSGVGLLLVAWRWYATTTAKSARRRRRRFETPRRGINRLG